MDENAIRVLVTRLARPHASGGDVIERAAILAEGAESAAIVAWIVAHNGIPEATVARPSNTGLYGSRLNDAVGAQSTVPSRYVLPAGTLA